MSKQSTFGAEEVQDNLESTAVDYDPLYSGGTKGQSSREMYIWVYPNTATEDDECSKGSDLTQEGLKTACAQIYADSTVTYYQIRKFPITTYSAPNLTDLGQFDTWLRDGQSNGTGENLKNRTGAHLLVHGKSCSQAYAGGEYADDCNGNNATAFNRGVNVYTPANCENEFKEASAIQEAIHPFISYRNSIVQELFNADQNDEHNGLLEHALGEVRDYTVTPMLTYHLDDDITNTGDCDGDGTSPAFYGQDLTSCTIDAVEHTAEWIC